MPSLSSSEQQRVQNFQSYRNFCADALFGGTLKFDACVKKLHELTDSKFENISVLLDVLESLDIEVEVKSVKNAELKEKFKEFCRKLIKSFLPEDVVKVNLDCFGDEGVSSRYVKMKTKLFYKQLKFNLLREESEGYAKLLVELNQEIMNRFVAQTALERVRCLIGQFNLDPNRVLDIILECFECRLVEHEFFVELLRLFRANSSDICHILGFKFTFYQERFGTYAVGRKADREIYYVAALLVHCGLLELPSICCYLTPKQQTMVEENKKFVEEATKKQKKLAAASLAVEKEPSEVENADARKDDIVENQKLSLLLALLDVGEWNHAKYLLDRMPEFYALRYPDVARTLCRLIDRTIDDLYQKSCSLYHLIRSSTDDIRSRETNSDELSFVTVVRSAGNFKEFAQNVLPIAAHLGPTVAFDPVLYTKLIRICSAFLEEKSKNSSDLEPYYEPLVEFCEDVLVPAISLVKDNCAVAEELWNLLKQFPYTTRYRIYGRWKHEHLKRHPLLVLVKGEVTGKTRYIMKRLTKETTKPAGRQIGKLGHNNPTIVFDYILNQIIQFENLISPVVESLKFMTNLSYDVLAYCIIEHLSSPEKEKLKVSDATLSPWLQSLATFVGSVFKKYSIELTGVLQYVANQLKTGKSFDLCVLREIVENMSGIETTAGLTQEQLEASAGGDILRQEGGFFVQARNTKRSVSRLKDALLQEDLVVSLCILMAQQRGSIIFKEGVNIHLKLVGQMLDQCQETLVQFASFLSMNLKPEDYVKHMPSVVRLMCDYHVNSDAAMYLARPVHSYMINSAYDELKRADRANKSLTAEKKAQHYKTAWNQVLTPLTNEITKQFPSQVWQDLNPQLFASFWVLSVYDVNVPMASYERELEKIRKALSQMDENREASEAKRKKDKESKLVEEQRRQQEHVARVTTRLEGEKDEWFPLKSPKGASITQFLQMCLFPRCVFTDLDAIFCAKFVQIIHSLKTTNFSTLICYDRIFCDISPLISCMSEYEANHYGRFLCASLESVMRWHKDKEVFDKECSNFPGFVTRFRNTTTNSEAAKDIVDYENYRHVVHKWHFKLTKAFLVSLGSGSYVQVRNALLVLIKILPQYPILKQFAEAISKKVVTLRDEEKDKRQDLHVLAASYGGHLKLRKNPMVIESEFHHVVAKEASEQAKQVSAVAASITSTKVAISSSKKEITVNDIDKKDAGKQSAPSSKPASSSSSTTMAAPSTKSSATSNKESARTNNNVQLDNSSIVKPMEVDGPSVPETQKKSAVKLDHTKLKTSHASTALVTAATTSGAKTSISTASKSSSSPVPPKLTNSSSAKDLSRSNGQMVDSQTSNSTKATTAAEPDGPSSTDQQPKKSSSSRSSDHSSTSKSSPITTTAVKKDTTTAAVTNERLPTKLRTTFAEPTSTSNSVKTSSANHEKQTSDQTTKSSSTTPSSGGKSSSKKKERESPSVDAKAAAAKRDSSSAEPKAKRDSSGEPKPKRSRASPVEHNTTSRRTTSKDRKAEKPESRRSARSK